MQSTDHTSPPPISHITISDDITTLPHANTTTADTPIPERIVSQDAVESNVINGTNGTPCNQGGSLQDVCAELHERLLRFLEKTDRGAESQTEAGLRKGVRERTRVSLGVIVEALERYGLKHLSLSYNGGKDCLVLLVLYLVALHIHHNPSSPLSTSKSGSSHPPVTEITNTHTTPSAATSASTSTPHYPTTLSSIYIVPPSPFPEVESFVQQSALQYHLHLAHTSLPEQHMREAFAAYLADNPDVKAIFVGTRRTDPHGKSLTFFDPTDHGWPSFMRVHPVIDWHYREIWAFIRELQIPYCHLYDLGYTSLGGTNDTFPNPALRVEKNDGENGTISYRPAYELWEDDEERLGRDRR